MPGTSPKGLGPTGGWGSSEAVSLVRSPAGIENEDRGSQLSLEQGRDNGRGLPCHWWSDLE